MKSLRRFLTLGPVSAERVIFGNRRPLGYLQVTPGGAAAFLVLPALPAAGGLLWGYARIQNQGTVNTDIARWRDDGVAPTATIGMTINGQESLDYYGELTAIQFIVGAGAPVLNISIWAA